MPARDPMDKDLRNKIIKYFETHSAQECADHFNISRREVKNATNILYKKKNNFRKNIKVSDNTKTYYEELKKKVIDCYKCQIPLKEILTRLNIKKQQIHYIRYYYGIKRRDYKKQCLSKYSKTENEVMAFYKTHTMRETASHFNMNYYKVMAIYEMARRNKKFKTKDKRIRSSWSTKELLFLLQQSGIRHQDDISKTLKRGKSFRVLKEKLQYLKIKAKYVNGLTLGDAIPICTDKLPIINGKKVPWILIEKYLSTKSKEIKYMIKSMARFQRFIFNNVSNTTILKKVGYVQRNKKAR